MSIAEMIQKLIAADTDQLQTWADRAYAEGDDQLAGCLRQYALTKQ